MPKSAARPRKQPKRRPVPPAARVARPPLPAVSASSLDDLDDDEYAADLGEEVDEGADDESPDERPSGAGRGFVRTVTLRQGRVPTLLRDVIEARHEIARAERKLDKSVRAARDHGASWEDIGVALGMSRQGAAKRFG